MFQFAHSVKCPKCRVGVGKWCRENGKARPPHPERGKLACDVSGSVLGPRKAA